MKLKAETAPGQFLKLLVALILIASLFIYGMYFWHLRKDIASGYGDFIIFYTGAQMLRGGLGQQLYDYEVQKAFQNRFNVPIRVGPLPYNHPPFELLLFLPLSYLPYSSAYLVWTIINFLLLIATLRLLAPFLSRQHAWIFQLMLFAFYPVFMTFVHGQDSIFILFLLSAVFSCLKNQRDETAGILLALGLFKPQLVLPLALVLVFKRRWRATAGFMITGIGLLILSLYMIGGIGVSTYITLLTQINQQQYTIDPAKMPTIRGFLESMLSKDFQLLGHLMIFLMSLATIGWLLHFWRGEYTPATTSFDLKFSFSIAITLLTSYHLYVHDLTLFYIPGMLTMNHILAGNWRSSAARVPLLFIMVLWYPLMYIWLLDSRLFFWAFWLILGLAAVVSTEIAFVQKSTLQATVSNAPQFDRDRTHQENIF